VSKAFPIHNLSLSNLAEALDDAISTNYAASIETLMDGKSARHQSWRKERSALRPTYRKLRRLL